MSDYHYLFSIRGYSVPALLELSARNPSPDLAFIHEEHDGTGPQFFFTSPHLDELREPAEVWGRATQLLDIFHGLYVLAEISPNSPFSTPRPVLYDLRDLLANRRLERVPPQFPGELPYTPAVLAEPVPWVYEGRGLGQALLLARTQPDVRTLLHQLGQELDLRTLYAIVDTLRHYDGADFDTRLQRAGISNKQYKLFTRTADNFTASGLQARHGPSHNQPPAQPMPLADAQYLVKLLSRQYLTDRYGIPFSAPVIYQSYDDLLTDF